MTISDYSINKLYDRDGKLSGIKFVLTNYKFSESYSAKAIILIYAVKDQQWFAENPFNDNFIALEPGRAFAIADSMGLKETVTEILKEEDL